MQTIKITAEQDCALQKLSFVPSWYVVQNEGRDVQGFQSRAKARAYNTSGHIYDARDFGKKVVFEVVDLAAKIETPISVAPFVHPTLAAFISAPTVNKVADRAARIAADTKAPKTPILRASEIERPCKRVWHIADEMMHAAGGLEKLRRKDVLARCVAEKIAYYTARTQYQLWLTIQNGGTI